MNDLLHSKDFSESPPIRPIYYGDLEDLEFREYENLRFAHRLHDFPGDFSNKIWYALCQYLDCKRRKENNQPLPRGATEVSILRHPLIFKYPEDLSTNGHVDQQKIHAIRKGIWDAITTIGAHNSLDPWTKLTFNPNLSKTHVIPHDTPSFTGEDTVLHEIKHAKYGCTRTKKPNVYIAFQFDLMPCPGSREKVVIRRVHKLGGHQTATVCLSPLYPSHNDIQTAYLSQPNLTLITLRKKPWFSILQDSLQQHLISKQLNYKEAVFFFGRINYELFYPNLSEGKCFSIDRKKIKIIEPLSMLV